MSEPVSCPPGSFGIGKLRDDEFFLSVNDGKQRTTVKMSRVALVYFLDDTRREVSEPPNDVRLDARP